MDLLFYFLLGAIAIAILRSLILSDMRKFWFGEDMEPHELSLSELRKWLGVK